jgi:pimeloyl-ACP methyl ester carboxylesterase
MDQIVKKRAQAVLLMFAAVLLNVVGVAQAAVPFHSDRISVEVRGRGPDVVLIPGLASSPEVWAATADRLDDTHRVHLVQVNGFAGAPAGANADGAVVAPLVGELNRYITEAGLKRPAVIGHSLGGFTALRLAAEHPQAVGRVLVVDSLPFFPLLFSPAATAEAVTPQANAMRDAMLAMPAERFPAVQAAGMGRLVKSAEARTRHARIGGASDPAVVARAMHELMTTDLRLQLGQIEASVTVLYAWDPAMGPTTEAYDQLWRGAYAGLKGATLTRVDGSFHFIMDDQPERFTAEVEGFLAGR